MDEGLPLITAALFCERVIEGKDGTLSAIRILDRASLEFGSVDPRIIKALTDAQGVQKPGFPITGLLCLKAGTLSGNFKIDIESVKPSGKRNHLHTFPVEFKAGDTGVNIVLNIVMAADEVGTHWFEVTFEGRLLTKIPLTIVHGPAPDAPMVDAVPKKA